MLMHHGLYHDKYFPAAMVEKYHSIYFKIHL